MLFSNTLVLIRGGGDLATGVALRLAHAGFPLVITELARPLAVRRTVAFASVVLAGEMILDGVKAMRVQTVDEARALALIGIVAVLIDPAGDSIPALKPRVLIDGRMKKSRDESNREAAPLVISLGPGATAGVDCHAVIETNRGHFLGQVYWEGQTQPDTGAPDPVQGREMTRVLRAPAGGMVTVHAEIGDRVTAGQVVATVGEEPVCAVFSGVLRGLIADGMSVAAGLKIGDVDPRNCREYCFSVSDKSLTVGGGVLEAILSWLNRTEGANRT